MTPQWVLLTNPVPAEVTAEATRLLHILKLGQSRTETCSVDCATAILGAQTRILKYICQDHGGGKTGITAYGLV